MSARLLLVFDVITVLMGTANIAYTLSAVVLEVTKPLPRHRFVGVLNVIWKITKYPALAWVFVDPIYDILHGRDYWWNALLTAVNFWVWWSCRDAGDDDWTRKIKDRLGEVVREVNGRLVTVVPEPS